MSFATKRDKWDARFMAMARDVASWSKDRSTKVGCVIVDSTGAVRSTGYNGFPRGVNDDVNARHERPAKYRWTEHAERNAIYHAARMGVPLLGCIAYVMWYPCMDCARAIAQSGIVEVVCGLRPDFADPQWGPQFLDVEPMLIEAGVTLRILEAEGSQ